MMRIHSRSSSICDDHCCGSHRHHIHLLHNTTTVCNSNSIMIMIEMMVIGKSRLTFPLEVGRRGGGWWRGLLADGYWLLYGQTLTSLQKFVHFAIIACYVSIIIILVTIIILADIYIYIYISMFFQIYIYIFQTI
jgi:hypothetical protein